MARTAAIGEQDFSKIIEKDYFYIDKTVFIKEWWENGDTVTLITRPRRFGKTLAMSMLEKFFSVSYAGKGRLFENLHIWKEKGYQELQGTYPVIFLSFADIKAGSYGEAYEGICRVIGREYRRYSSMMESDCFLQSDRKQFHKILNGEANIVDIRSSINQLSEYLYMYYGKRVILLLDEYDTPMQEAYVNGYWTELAEFMRKLMNSTFKTNVYLERGIMTGITRVSKESVFSDLNNLVVVTTATKLYETAFGFTENEVFQALKEFGLQDKKEEVKHWYDGFRFGNCESIYNPWSVIHFLKFREFHAYWANTSSNRMIGELIQKAGPEIKIAVEDMLQCRTISVQVEEQIIFNQLEQNENAIWSLLLASGYLKIAGLGAADSHFGAEGMIYELAPANFEMVLILKKMVSTWFERCSSSYHDFIKSLLANDLRSMNAYMNQVARTVVSSFDSGNHPSDKTEPERFYHGLVLGIMLSLGDRYRMTSNRESGFGRYDILLEPRNRSDDGIIFEFKVLDAANGEKSLEDTAKAAIWQIVCKQYAAVLEEACGSNRIRIYGVAFRGKEVLIKGGYLREFELSGL